MDRVCLGPSIIDEKEVNHWAGSPDGHRREVIEYADILFLISSKGVPRHCTTSVNRGDTVKHIPREEGERASSVTSSTHYRFPW